MWNKDNCRTGNECGPHTPKGVLRHGGEGIFRKYTNSMREPIINQASDAKLRWLSRLVRFGTENSREEAPSNLDICLFSYIVNYTRLL